MIKYKLNSNNQIGGRSQLFLMFRNHLNRPRFEFCRISGDRGIINEFSSIEIGTGFNNLNLHLTISPDMRDRTREIAHITFHYFYDPSINPNRIPLEIRNEYFNLYSELERIYPIEYKNNNLHINWGYFTIDNTWTIDDLISYLQKEIYTFDIKYPIAHIVIDKLKMKLLNNLQLFPKN